MSYLDESPEYPAPAPIGPKAKFWVKWTARLVVIVSIAWIVFLALLMQDLRRDQNAVTFHPATGPNWASYQIKGVDRPATLSIAQSAGKIAESDEVFGVVVNGKARAYRIATMQDKLSHIVNDVIGNQAVTIAFCDQSDCVRVYHDAQKADPLPVSVAGLLDGEMVVFAAGVQYLHKTSEPLRPLESPPPFPYEQLSAERMSWKAWKSRHPETDVYVGSQADVTEK